MKLLSIFLLVVFLLGCTRNVQEKKNPIEGTWEMISAKQSNTDTTYLFPETDYQRNIKMFSHTYFIFIYQDTSRQDIYGCGGGKYTLNGDNATEHIEFFDNTKWIGKSVTYTIKVKGDTLIQSGILPAKKYGIGDYDWDLYEVYRRID